MSTLMATGLAQLAEGKRAKRTRDDAIQKELREAKRNDYREILRFIAKTRLFVIEMRRRLEELEEWSAQASSDAREVEDLEARALMLRRQFIDELPGIQGLVGMSAPDEVIAIFDRIGSFGPEIAGGMQTVLHLKIDGKRYAKSIEAELGRLDQLVTLLTEARDVLRSEQLLK
ncbi:hypothetical protein AU072_09605 [Mycolicibacterium novocastrense]|nr:hypothetical protein AU072_09605 [Mycolicibacterium novocastrense]